jgi:hypothetical protein
LEGCDLSKVTPDQQAEVGYKLDSLTAHIDVDIIAELAWTVAEYSTV